jgi:glycosyltransferase involved in cell wall biosynthesis
MNVAYNYDLLFAALERLVIPWTFTWIGGLRRPEDQPILDRVNAGISSRGWQDRFRVTGWVDDEERDRLLGECDVYCALFSARSSSESLATAMGAGCAVVATDLPLTRELAEDGVLRCVAHDAALVAAEIGRLHRDDALRQSLTAACGRYAAGHTYQATATAMIDVYEGLIRGVAR